MSIDLITTAARAATRPDFSNKNADNIAALMALLEAAEVIAQAIYDNAKDDRTPTDQKQANELRIRSWRIDRLIIESSEEPTSAPPM